VIRRYLSAICVGLLTLGPLVGCADRFGDFVVVEVRESTPPHAPVSGLSRDDVQVRVTCAAGSLIAVIDTWEPELEGRYLLSILALSTPEGPCTLSIEGVRDYRGKLESDQYPMP